MKKYIVLYQAPVSAMEQMKQMTAEQSKAAMDAWMKWAEKAGPALVDLGAPLGNGAHVKPGEVGACSTEVAGFSILQGESIKDITKLLEGHPHLAVPGFSIDVHEALPISM